MIDQLFDLFLRCFPEYQTTREWFVELLKPEEAHIIAEYAQGQLAGYAMVHGGSIPVLCVAENHRGQGMGSRLLAAAEGYIRSLGQEKLTLGCGPHYLLQGVPETGSNVSFFEKRGYTAGWTSVNMELSLDGFDRNSLTIPPAPIGLEYRFAEKSDRAELLAAVEAAEPNWPSVFESCVDPIYLAVLDGRIVGFEVLAPKGGRFLRPGHQVGCVGCVGVIPAYQERGIGMDMVAHGIQWLKNQGCTLIELRYVWLEKWYGKRGFQTVARQWMGEKKLSSRAMKKIFLICSKAFYSRLASAKAHLEAAGWEVYQPFTHDRPEAESEWYAAGPEEHSRMKSELFRRSRERIKRMDAVLVLNFEKNGAANYIGGSTFLELYEAFMEGKRIFLWNDVPQGLLFDEISAFSPTIIHGDLSLVDIDDL